MKGLVAAVIASYLSFGSVQDTKAQDVAVINVSLDEVVTFTREENSDIFTQCFVERDSLEGEVEAKMIIEFTDDWKDGWVDRVKIYDFERRTIYPFTSFPIAQLEYDTLMEKYFPSYKVKKLPKRYMLNNRLKSRKT